MHWLTALFLILIPIFSFADVRLTEYSIKLAEDTFVKNEIFSLVVQAQGEKDRFQQNQLALVYPKEINSEGSN